jgi:large repetitive protein
VVITGVDDLPVIANVETTPLSYQSGNAAVAVTSTLTVSDSDDTTLSGGTVSITAGFDSGADSLSFTNQNGITGSYDASTGVLTLSGDASVADYQAALRSVVFSTTDASASPAARTVSFVVTDTDSETSNTASRTIDVTAAATPPTAINQSYTAVGNTPLAVGTTPAGPAANVSGSLLNGDSGDASCGTLTVTGNSTPAHGSVAVNPDGTFTYLPNAGFSGTDTFQYTITCSGSQSTATATVTITVGTLVWYVNNAAAPGGNGEAGTPFSTLAAANAALGANSIVFLYQGSGTYPGGLSMMSGDSLFGQPHGLTVSGYSLVAAGGSNPVITNAAGDGIDLGSGADVEDVSVSGPTGNGISGSGVTGTITIEDCSITGYGENGVEILPASGTTTVTISDNNVQYASPTPEGSGIVIDDPARTETGTVSGTISGNTVGSPTVVGSGNGIGINLMAEGSFTDTLAITNNNIYQYVNDSGINFETEQGSAAMNLTITGNTIADPGTFGSWGLLGESGAETGDNGLVCADISGNSLMGSAQAGQGGADIELDQEFGTTFQLPGYTGGDESASAVASFVAGNNTGNGTPSVIATVSGSGGGFTGGGACATP